MNPLLVRWIVASLHLLALPLGLGGVWVRARALRGPLYGAGLRRVFAADTVWGLAALLWIGTGVARAFGGLEKGTAYYLHHPAFYAKMALLVAILLLEVWPMVALLRWRGKQRRGLTIDTSSAPALARISEIQAMLIVLMVFAATALARDVPL